MSGLKQRLQSDLTTAMKQRDEVRTRTLRMVLTAVSNAQVAGNSARELDDDEVTAVITREAKKRREAADAFEEGGRAERAAAERAEGAVLAEYLPAQLSDDELAEIVATAIAEVGVSGPKGMGPVMKVVKPRIGDRAEGKRISEEVRRQLG